MPITFRDCIVRKRIFPFEAAKYLVEDEFKDAKEDLKSAQEEFSKKGIKWATIKAYYAMFHTARTLLYSKGYRERGHYCLYLAMHEFFVKENILEHDLVEAFYNCMILREEADYKRTFSEESAALAIESAKKLFAAAEKIARTSQGQK